MNTKQELKEIIIEAVARGWTYKENEKKTMDTDLATAIVEEVKPLIDQAYEAGRREIKDKLREIIEGIKYTVQFGEVVEVADLLQQIEEI